MSRADLALLLVEDNPADAVLVRETLGMSFDSAVDLAHTDTLNSALEALERASFDVVLCDLGLPDSDHLETLEHIVLASKGTPIIVLTGFDDGEMPLQALKAGAQDFVAKDVLASPDIGREVLVRAIRYAIARSGGRGRDRRDLGEADRVLVEVMSGRNDTSATARAYGHLPLVEGAPSLFATLTEEYNRAMEEAMREVSYRVETERSRIVSELGQSLGRFGATPKDVVELHVAALREASNGKNSSQVRGLKDEARLILVEVMGNLASYYRRYAWRGQPSPQPGSETSDE